MFLVTVIGSDAITNCDGTHVRTPLTQKKILAQKYCKKWINCGEANFLYYLWNGKVSGLLYREQTK